ncbi:hypothetical protein [Roseivivax marinus]|uniref:hypothetical protein n=1 Tax=Roseivivax marinus TaxID=1379903 RepID=UPI00273DBCD3|nr:hypothetical protein [Roseivivax marinus]
MVIIAMTESDLEHLRQARDRVFAIITDATFRKMQQGALDREDTAEDRLIEAVGGCLLASAEAYYTMALSYGLRTLQQCREARSTSFPPHDPDREVPF